MLGTIAVSMLVLWLFGVIYTTFIARVIKNAADNMYKDFQNAYDSHTASY